MAENIITEVKNEVGDKHVVVGISGGVDSLVAATLIHKAIGNRLHAVFVDTGLLRKGEVEQVASYLRKNGFKRLHVIDASQLFLKRLEDISDPEQKRKIIGHSFIEVFEKAIKSELKKHTIAYLAQGTIYPDRIESASTSKTVAKIKSHHNLTLPEKMGFKILEPIKDLYKDEVRRVGITLGLPRELLWRHPFPGPGLAVRIVGEITNKRLQILREADAVFIEELRKAGEYEKIWPCSFLSQYALHPNLVLVCTILRWCSDRIQNVLLLPVYFCLTAPYAPRLHVRGAHFHLWSKPFSYAR